VRRRSVLLVFPILAAAILSGCGVTPATVFSGSNGESVATVQIDSSPTPAWIYVNHQYVGTTPLEHDFAYASATEGIDIVAEPIYLAQARQHRRLDPGPLPFRVHFFMNNRSRDSGDD
jgi:hypothetical protein